MNILDLALKALPLKQGTTDHQATLFGRACITRYRMYKHRTEITDGPCFRGVHLGLTSFYVAKKVSRFDSSSLAGIKDDKGVVTVSVTNISKPQ
jgi:hypothetical protein|tara:strand:- start:22 stop:303 length:282 start_codon:yes stop_codon:yes gene_type:complete